LRAVSVFLVIGGHLAYAHPELDTCGIMATVLDGDLGVRIFFVISGFLITALMIQEKEKYGSVSLKNFYLRRIFRLFPVQYAFIAFVYILTILTPTKVEFCSFITALTFTKNYACGEWIDGHLWSLAVEEQFYLIWAIAFVALRPRALLILAIGLICLAPESRAVEYLSGHRFYTWLTSNADALMIGCVLALLASKFRSSFERAAAWYPTITRAAALLLMYVPILLGQRLLFGKLTVTLGPLLQAICAGFLIVSLLYHRQGLAFKFLNLPIIAFIGTISYSLYVWQMPFLARPDIYGGNAEWFLKFTIDLAVVVLAALVSYYLLERPFAKLRRRLHAHPKRQPASVSALASNANAP
jgi:peptidoglycan/LPS O-acetylase OafA/YrhL